MKRSLDTSDHLLSADFARQVLKRVDAVQRQRKFRRRALTAAVLSAAAIVTILLTRPNRPLVAEHAAPASSWAAASAASGAYNAPTVTPASLFFPNAYRVSDFAESSNEAAWHYYDPWWNSSSP